MKPNPLRELANRHQERARWLEPSDPKTATEMMVRAGDLEGYAIVVDGWADEARADERARTRAEVEAGTVAWLRARADGCLHAEQETRMALDLAADAIERGSYRAKEGA